ncbi:MAG: hypothetical protein AAGD38_16070 [Acidobacteriota bacterium]
MRISFILLLTLLTVAPVSGVVVIEAEIVRYFDGRESPDALTVTIDDDRVRLDNRQTADEQTTMFFFPARGEKPDRLVMINHKKETFVEIDEATIQQLSDQLEAMMKQFQARLADVDPDQRAAVEEMLAPRLKALEEGAEPVEKKVRDTKAEEVISGFPTRLFEVHQEEEHLRDVWVTPWKEVENGGEIQSALSALGGFFTRTFDRLNQSFAGLPTIDIRDNPFADLEKMNGFPVRTHQFEEGDTKVATTFHSVTTLPEPPADLWVIPEGYARQELSGR